MHIYAYGSICRGEISNGSDVDLLVLVSIQGHQFDPNVFSIYSHSRIEDLWKEGNPFAWHLALESRLIFTEDRQDFLRALGEPAAYRKCAADCEKFMRIFEDSVKAISSRDHTAVFELSTIFLAIRNIATCYSLGSGTPIFSRDSALKLGNESLALDPDIYSVLQSSRLLSVRGHGERPTKAIIQSTVSKLETVHMWMDGLVRKAKTQ